MTEYKIPDNEMDNMVSVYWQMLRELESRIDPDKDIMDKILVEGAFNILNRCNVTKSRPIWERKECTK